MKRRGIDPKTYRNAAILATALLIHSFNAKAEPPPGVNLESQTSKWYQSLFNKAGENCCSKADCRPAAVRPIGSGWEAFIDKRSFGPNAPDDWVRAPEKAMVYREDNPTGRNIVCFYNNEIRCITLNPGG